MDGAGEFLSGSPWIGRPSMTRNSESLQSFEERYPGIYIRKKKRRDMTRNSSATSMDSWCSDLDTPASSPLRFPEECPSKEALAAMLGGHPRVVPPRGMPPVDPPPTCSTPLRSYAPDPHLQATPPHQPVGWSPAPSPPPPEAPRPYWEDPEKVAPGVLANAPPPFAPAPPPFSPLATPGSPTPPPQPRPPPLRPATRLQLSPEFADTVSQLANMPPEMLTAYMTMAMGNAPGSGTVATMLQQAMAALPSSKAGPRSPEGAPPPRVPMGLGPPAHDDKVAVDPRKYKTRMCRNWQTTGHCPYEHTCCFSHGEHEMRTVTDNHRLLASIGYFSNVVLLAMTNSQKPALPPHCLYQQPSMFKEPETPEQLKQCATALPEGVHFPYQAPLPAAFKGLKTAKALEAGRRRRPRRPRAPEKGGGGVGEPLQEGGVEGEGAGGP